MIRVTIELLPHGDDKHPQVIGEGRIHNTGTKDNGETGEYYFEFTTPGWYVKDQINVPGDVWEGVLFSFPRTRAHVLHLLRNCLNCAYDLRELEHFNKLKGLFGDKQEGDN